MAASLTAVLRAFGVTQKPRYFPNMPRVCASTAGSEPNTVETIGTNTHCSIMLTVRQREYLAGRGGSKTRFMYTEKIRNTVAACIMVRVKTGRLKIKT